MPLPPTSCSAALQKNSSSAPCAVSASGGAVAVAGQATPQACSHYACAAGHCREGRHDAERMRRRPRRHPGSLQAAALRMYHVAEWGGHVAAVAHGRLTSAEARETVTGARKRRGGRMREEPVTCSGRMRRMVNDTHTHKVMPTMHTRPPTYTA